KTDDITLTHPVPANTMFWTRRFWTNTTGIIYKFGVEDQAIGDAMNVAASGLSDQTVTCGTVTDAGIAAFFPIAIISNITVPSVCILGDSIAFGSADGYYGTSGDVGIVERSIGPNNGYA